MNKTEKITKRIESIKKLYSEDGYRRFFIKAERELFYIIKSIVPKNAQGHLYFGTGDPYYTGRILTVLALLFPAYGEAVEVIPEWDEEILDTGLTVKGKIYIFKIIYHVLVIVLDRDFKRVYRHIKKIEETND